ncbi:MAG: DUF4214 domain-containing protein [Acidimicrobiales bacterium]
MLDQHRRSRGIPWRAPLLRPALAAAATCLLASIAGPALPAGAADSDHSVPSIVINPGGGVDSGGADGLMFLVNSDGTVTDAGQVGQDQVWYRNTYQYCCGASAPMLNVGGTLYGEASAASSASAASWTDLVLVGVTGSATDTFPSATTGNGTAHFRYTATQGGRDYVVDRTISYTYPNTYVTDAYQITIPAGNTDEVKFYLGGDTAPGSDDEGVGVMLTSPRRTVYSVNPSSNIQIGYGEAPGSAPFDGARAEHYSTQYATIDAGGDIGFGVDASSHDAGIMVQWTLGSTPGIYDRALRQMVTPRGVALSATFSAATADTDDEVSLDFDLANTSGTDASGLDFTFALPSGLVIGSSSTANSCGGTLTAAAGGSSIQLSGGSALAAANCVVSVPVVAAADGDYSISSASVSGLANLSNDVGSATLTVGTPWVEPESACPANHGWNVVIDQTSRLYQASLGRSADNAGLLYWTWARLNLLSAQGLAENLLASSERMASSGSQTNAQFVEQLYTDVLGRSSDPGGLTYWVGRLDDSLRRSALVLLFSDSAEYVALTHTRSPLTDHQSQVCRLYETVFHRTPDDGGYSYWTGLLDSGLSPQHIAGLMLQTPEGGMVNDLSADDFVDHVYQGALDRASDPDGLAFWKGLMTVNGRPAIVVWLANTLEAISS